MTIRTFWHLIIKTIGIWIVIHGIMSLPEIVMTLILSYGSPYGGSPVFVITEALIFIAPILFYLLVLRFLVLKTQSIIDLLKLEKGFEETRIDLTIPYSKLLRIVIILIGGIVFIGAVPSLVEDLYLFITGNLPFSQSPKALSLIVGFAQAIAGFLVMNNSDIVQRYINKKSGEAETKQLDKDDF